MDEYQDTFASVIVDANGLYYLMWKRVYASGRRTLSMEPVTRYEYDYENYFTRLYSLRNGYVDLEGILKPNFMKEIKFEEDSENDAERVSGDSTENEPEGSD